MYLRLIFLGWYEIREKQTGITVASVLSAGDFSSTAKDKEYIIYSII